MSLTTDSLKTAIDLIHADVDPIGAEMNELDGRLGDGDLGVTLINGFNNLAGIKDELPADLGKALFAAAKAITAVSGSSFGTLMATAMMATGKSIKGQEAVEWSRMSELLTAAQDAMIARGGANLGDKTMLDVMDAIITALRDQQDPSTMLTVAQTAADATLDDFRDKPNKIGRARVYAEKSIGLDDPGMMAIKRMLEALAKA